MTPPFSVQTPRRATFCLWSPTSEGVVPEECVHTCCAEVEKEGVGGIPEPTLGVDPPDACSPVGALNPPCPLAGPSLDLPHSAHRARQPAPNSPQGGGGLHKSLPSSTPKCIHLLLFLKEVQETEWRLCGAEAREVMGEDGHTVVWRHRDRETQEELGPGWGFQARSFILSSQPPEPHALTDHDLFCGLRWEAT